MSRRSREQRSARSLGALLLVLGALVVTPAPASASAPAAFTWSGGSTEGSWSTAANWAGGKPPSGHVAMLSFPDLGSPCDTSPGDQTCYFAGNDLTGISTDAISIDDGIGYSIAGNQVTLGGGGLMATTAAASFGDSTLAVPLALSAPQQWTIDGNGTLTQAGSELDLDGDVTGASEALTMTLKNGVTLGLHDVEVGPLSATGPDGSLTRGFSFDNGGITLAGSLNGSDLQPVTLTHVGLMAAGDSTTGPLTMQGGEITAGTDEPLTIAGGLSLDPASAVWLSLTDVNSPPPITATGPVGLDGAELTVSEDLGCTSLPPGQTLTLLTTTGTLSGTFDQVPDGAVRGAIDCPPDARIDYTSHSVTATGVPMPTVVALAVGPAGALTNQPVTLTATVTPQAGPAAGSVTFENHGSPMAGCAARPVTPTGAGYTATCRTPLAAAANPQALSATFLPADGSGLASAGAAASLSVGRDPTTTKVSASDAAPSPGKAVTYTATVTPGDGGPATPTGAVQFAEAGTAIPGCGAQPVTASATASTATCSLTYSDAGAHTVTATYSGDSNFGGSAASPVTVTVAAARGGVTQIRAGLLSAIARVGNRVRMRSILRAGGLTLAFDAPEPGTAAIAWYQAPGAAHSQRADARPRRHLVATGAVRFTRAGSGRLRLRLTGYGRRLLKRSRSARLTAVGTFTPTGSAAVTVTRTFTLRG